jgi:dTMP kinase
MLIAVVGTDGAGKSTVTARTAEVLESHGHTVAHIDRWHIVDNPAYPATRFMRPDVADTRQCVAEMPNPSRFLFLMWSISMALLGGRTPGSGSSDVQMLDGYWMKHAASEVVYGLDRSWVESVVSALPVADVVIYLRISPEDTWRRKNGSSSLVPYECGMDPSCSRASFLRHQQAILALLDDWASTRRWVTVDAAQPLPDVLDEVVRAARDAVEAAPATSAGAGDPRVPEFRRPVRHGSR